MGTSEFIRSKIITEEKLSYILSYCRFKDNKIVFTNGCFDIIHRGHIEYLIKASELGSVLIIGLNTDKSVNKLKGAGRPVQDETTRAMILASFSFVDHIVVFDDETPAKLIEFIKPDILVKGGDYKPEDIVGYDIVKGKGGQVVTIDYISGYSSSDMIKMLRSQVL